MISGSLLTSLDDKVLVGKTVIFDNNIFVEGYRFQNEIASIINTLTDKGCPVTTIEPVRIEFLSKNRSVEELDKKLRFIEQILTTSEIPSATFQNEMKEMPLLYAFGLQCQSFKMVDFTLAAVLKKYHSNALLLTNDHHDFTPKLFDLLGLIPLVTVEGVKSLGLYQFSTAKYAKLIT